MRWTPTRRTFLKTGVAAAGAVAAGSAGALTVGLVDSPAARGAPPGRLVVIFLRGGQDHLSTVVPYTESDYHDARPTIAIPAGQVLDLDGQFGLHPAMTGLHTLYGAGRLAVVVAAGNPAGNRSHFLAQDLWEYGATSVPADYSGWLARYLGATAGSADSVFRALTVANNVDRCLSGYPALGIGQIEGFGLGGRSGTTEDLATLIGGQYFGPAPVEQTGTRALQAIGQVGALSGSNAPNPVTRALADAAILLDSGLGAEVVTLSIGGWDTHNDMGAYDAGAMRNLLLGLDGYLSTFQADLDARGLSEVTTVVMTEFGRRVAENGTRGTDHGFGCVMLVMGARVNGGVHGTWLGLSPAVIGARGDVVPTVDFRDVLGDCARDVLGVADPSTLFPGHTYTPVGVTS